MHDNQFKYSDERFADLQMLRYRLNGFESLSLSQKLYIFCLAKATLMGRDITFDQQGKYNLRIRKTRTWESCSKNISVKNIPMKNGTVCIR